jgi:hypothetical protein
VDGGARLGRQTCEKPLKCLLFRQHHAHLLR